MKYKDLLGITATKIFHLYEDKTLTDKKLRAMTKEILLEYEREKLKGKTKVIERLQKDSDDLQKIRNIIDKNLF
jgi:hypothetical protein